MKVYIFKLKNESNIYAYSINKEYVDIFISQRNMKLFKYQIIDLDKYDFMIFSNKMNNQKLLKDFLYDGENDIEIVATTEESSKLSDSCQYIQDICDFVKHHIHEYNLKNKYLKSILKITDKIILEEENKPVMLNINTFKLFYYLFRNTFSKYDVTEEI